MKKLTALFLFLIGISSSAHAWFFFFIPGSVIGKVADAMTGAEGNNCVGTTAKVGDVLTSPTGNTATIKSIYGEQYPCQGTTHPIRAHVEFNYSFSSKAGIDLPDSFKPIEINSVQRFNGALLYVHDENRKIGLFISALPRKPDGDGSIVARNMAANIVKAIEDGKVSNEEELTINGLHAYRFQVEGKDKGMFGRSRTYVATVLEAANEYVLLNASCRTDTFNENGAELKRFAFDVKGLAGEPPSEPKAATAQAAPVEMADAKASVVAQPTQDGAGIAERLRTLESLLKQGLINKKDYESKKQELLKSL